ncbi:MAG: hypothetical protein P8Z76_20815, partial [Alphaproteobacteria bacterium]
TKAPTSVWHVLLAAAGYAALIYAHIPSALLFSPVMVLFVLIRHRPSSVPRALVLPVVLGLGLAAAYLVPALTTQDYINASAWWELGDGHYDARNWLWLDGRDAKPFADVLLFAFLMTTAAGAYMAIDLWVRGHARSRILVFGAVSLLYAWFLMTYPSSLLWEHIEPLRKVQFPWRVGIVVDLCAAAVAAVWLDQVLARKSRGFVFKVYFCVPFVLFGIFYASSAMTLHEFLLSVVDPEGAQPIGEYDAPEYRTTWLVESGEGLSFGPLRDKLDRVPEVSLVSGDGTVRITRQDLDELEIAVEARTPVRVRFRRFYYPGWSLVDVASGSSYETGPSRCSVCWRQTSRLALTVSSSVGRRLRKSASGPSFRPRA